MLSLICNMKVTFILLAFVSSAQNLVPNYSFETYTMCPVSNNRIENAAPWNGATISSSSTDYFNSCSSPYGVPKHSGGFQYARTGNAYSGLFFMQLPYNDAREYLQVQLTSPLVQNITYYVEFYVNLHNGNVYYPCNNVSANLSITRPTTSTFGILQTLTPHIINPGNPIIGDTINWSKVSGCYLAQGGEEYLTIGNFMTDANTQTTGTATNTSSYYYVDDVTVVALTGGCVSSVNELTDSYSIKVYPNPNNGTFTIAYTFRENTPVFELYDLVGEKVSEKTLSGNDGIDNVNLDRLDAGVYFYKVADIKGKLLFSGKLIISK